jgi:hypothetical protein
MDYEKIGKVALGLVTGVGVTVIVSGLGLLLAWPIKWTWNVTMPYLFALPTITWGKAWCLHFLAGCLIKSSLTTK